MPTHPTAAVVAAGANALAGLGAPAAVGLLLFTETGIPFPIPADLLILLVGDQVAAGQFPLWAAILGLEAVAIAGTTALFLLARGPGSAVIRRFGPRLGLTGSRLDRAGDLLRRRGTVALATGRGTPGLRTVTVVAAGGSGLSPWQALPALILGASLFHQLHLLLGYALGPLARAAVEQAQGVALVVLGALVVGAAVFWLVRRGRRAGAQAFTEAGCPACLALGLLSQRQRVLSELG